LAHRTGGSTRTRSASKGCAVKFRWDSRGPLDRTVLDTVIAAIQQRLDLLAVLRERYGLIVEDAGERWRCVCPLRSTVPDFAGTCAEQDAAESSGEVPRNLWVSEGETTLVWRCHSCKRHGDVVDLIEHADDLPREGQAISLRAVRVAAQLAGVGYLMDQREPDQRDEPDDALARSEPRRAAPRLPAATVDFDRARTRNYLAATHWHEQLRTDAGAKARAELQRRGVTEQQIATYQIGYALPEWRDLAKRIPESHQRDASVLGLLGRNRHGSYYDRQRDRIVLPYCEPARGDRPPSITGFAGRDMSGDPKAPKWLNSTNVPGVWEKSSALFGLYQAQQRVQSTGLARVVVTEGGFDTLAYDRAELSATALVSTALSHAHCEVLVDTLGLDVLTIAFDGDATGRRDAIVAATTALTFDLPYAAVTLVDPGDGKDPDDLSASALVDQWHAPLSVVDFALIFGALATQTHRLALLAALTDEPAEQLRRAWSIDTSDVDKQRARGTTASPAQRLSRRLTEQPDLARSIARADIDDVFAAEPVLRRRLADLAFGETTDERALPRDVLRDWLALRLTQTRDQLATHNASDPFADAASHDAFRDWFTRGETLRVDIARMQKLLADESVSA
jgi:DNA primase